MTEDRAPFQHMRTSFSVRELRLVEQCPAPDVPPLGVGDRCRLNSGGPLLTVVDVELEHVVVAWSAGCTAEEAPLPRACVRRARAEQGDSNG